MTHEELQSLLGVYALDAVEPDEALLVEEHLRDCPQCRSEVEGHRSVATLLGNAGAVAPAGIWDRIAGELDDEAPTTTPDHDDRVLAFPTGGRDSRPTAARSRVATVFTAVAAAVVLLAGAAGVITIQRQQDRVDDLAAQVSATSDDRAAAAALADPTSTVVSLQSPGDAALEVRAVITAEGRGYLLGAPLPDAGADSTYQLWGLADEQTVSLGLLGHEPGVFEFQVEDPVSGLAITAEQAGGVDQSTNAPLVVGDLTPRGDDNTLTS